jgi:hypothetical protein
MGRYRRFVAAAAVQSLLGARFRRLLTVTVQAGPSRMRRYRRFVTADAFESRLPLQPTDGRVPIQVQLPFPPIDDGGALPARAGCTVSAVSCRKDRWHAADRYPPIDDGRGQPANAVALDTLSVDATHGADGGRPRLRDAHRTIIGRAFAKSVVKNLHGNRERQGCAQRRRHADAGAGLSISSSYELYVINRFHLWMTRA